jgi:hypothetical protein
MKCDSIFFLFFVICKFEHRFVHSWFQVSAVTDQPIQANAATAADLDDDEGGGLVSIAHNFFF